MDPLAEETPVFSTYHYCYDNPVNYIDPFGLQGSDPNDDRDIYGRKKHDRNGVYIDPKDRPGGMFATGYGDPGCGHWETTMAEHGSYATVANDPLSSNGISIVSVACITYSRTFVWDNSSRYRKPEARGGSLGDMKNNPPDHPEYESPKGGDKKVRNPNGRGSGWIDNKVRVWVPEDHNGTHAPHWDRQNPKGGGYTPV